MEAVIAAYPRYGFDRNQGYITKEQPMDRVLEAIRRHHRSYNCAIYHEIGLRLPLPPNRPGGEYWPHP